MTEAEPRSDPVADGFPGEVLEVLILRVARDLEAAVTFYAGVLGARLLRRGPGLAFLDLAGARLVLSESGGPTSDKPWVTFDPPDRPDRVSAELILRVRDIDATHRELADRGARFLTPPVRFPWEIRCFLRDPDGHLIEITQPPAVTPQEDHR